MPTIMLVRQVLFASGIGLAGGLGGAAMAIAQTITQPYTPIFENLSIAPGFTQTNNAAPTVLRGISGGERLAQEITGRISTPTGECQGFIDDTPDHQLELQAFFNYLELQVQSPADTTLVVRGPGGTWCNDDYITMNPGIAGQWFSGTYSIWIGSFAENTYHPYVIRVLEQAPESLVPESAQ